MALSDFNKNREVLKIKNYKEFIAQEKLKKPEWLKIKISPNRQTIKEVKNLLASNILSTVCEQACCPNLGECFNNKRATFLETFVPVGARSAILRTATLILSIRTSLNGWLKP